VADIQGNIYWDTQKDPYKAPSQSLSACVSGFYIQGESVRLLYHKDAQYSLGVENQHESMAGFTSL